MKKSIVSIFIIMAIPLIAYAGEGGVTRAGIRQETSMKEGTVNISEGPKNQYEVAALFKILEQKGVITRAELSKEVQHLDQNQFSDPDPYISIR